MPLRKFRHAFVAISLVGLLFGQVTWALAGTTGGLGGTITDADSGNAPIAGAAVSAVSASQSATTTTDANGRYVFLSLAPDTYTISITKTGYEPTSQAGISVFADQHVSVDIPVHKALKTIARVTSRSSNDLVKAGTTSDVYAVNAATAEKVVAIGGGGNLNSAYSALASQPGVTLGYGGIGWGQTVYIHGASYSQVGYEYDGVPVNRAFDNYNANSLSNLGQQELQVATGGANASSVSATVGGYINQVIRTGTYPGFGGFDIGGGAPTFYHTLKAEAGGAAPNRLFSYYVGLIGSDQDFRSIDQFNGGGQFYPGILPNVNYGGTLSAFPGVVPICLPPTPTSGFVSPTKGTTIPDQGCASQPFGNTLSQPVLGFATTANYFDREGVLNFHFGIPHKRDGGRDDIQLLYDVSYQHQTFTGSVNDYGGYAYLGNQLFGNCDPAGTGKVDSTGAPICGTGFLPYLDTTIFKPGVAFGQTVAQGTTPGTSAYYFPNTPLNRVAGAPIPTNLRPGQINDAGIVKAQYQHNIGSNAYLRLYGYSFYSDWLNSDPVVGELLYGLGNYQTFPESPDYELITHTRGGELQYANQFNSKNLVTATINYVTANVSRYNNATYRVNPNLSTGTSPFTTTGRVVSVATNFVATDAAGNPILDGAHCLSFKTGAPTSCFDRASEGSFNDPTRATYCLTHACTLGAGKWVVTNTGPAGTLNGVTPKFTSAAITDEFRPNDKLLLNFGARWDRFEYDLVPTNSGALNFWFGAAQNSFCYDPAAGNAPVTLPQTFPATVGGAPMFVGQTCPTSLVSGLPTLHPNGVGGNLLYAPTSHSTYSVSKFEPRISGTYTFNPDTVVRFSAGQYVNPFNTATVQYLDASPSRTAFFDYQAFFGIGFTTPEHDVQPTKSTNVDLSLEKRLHGSDVSFKLSPFYRYVKDQTQDTFIGPGFVSAIPQGNETAYGVEFQINKGDPTRNGFSGQLSYTYTHATMKFNPIGNTGLNSLDSVNAEVALYNSLTKAGSGTSYKTSSGQTITLGTAAPCYLAGAPDTTDCTVTGNTITVSPTGLTSGVVINPYYFNAPQGYYDPHASYPLYQTFPNIYSGVPDTNGTILWPHVFAGFLNYKHNKLSITPNFQLIDGFSGGSTGGGQYGSPLSIIGLDPRGCAGNQGQAFAAVGGTLPPGTNPGLPDYLACAGAPGPNGYLYIPNPYTGKFDNFGQYQNPWLLNINAQIRYDVSPRVTANLILANIYNRCFGGDKGAWVDAAPPGRVACGYYPNPFFAGGLTQQPGTGFFYGTSPAGPGNPKPYSNLIFYPYGAQTSFLPFQAFLQVNIKL